MIVRRSVCRPLAREGFRHMVVSRRLLPSIVLAVGTAMRSNAQTEGPAVSVLPPRALAAQAIPALSSGFGMTDSNLIAPVSGPAPGQLQRMPTGDPIPAASDSTAKPPVPNSATGPSPPKIDWPIVPYGPITMPGPALPSHAPIWRWYGYGAVNFLESPSATAPVPRAPILPMPTPVTIPSTGSSIPMAPMGPELNLGFEVRPPNPVPVMPASEVSPPAISLTPLTSESASSRQMQRATDAPVSNSYSTGVNSWSQMATLSPPSSVPESSSASAVRNVSYSVALPQTPPISSVIRSIRPAVERACIGRGRDLELIPNGRTSLLVRLKVRQSSDGELLANVIARLPELEPYQVLFEMQVAR